MRTIDGKTQPASNLKVAKTLGKGYTLVAKDTGLSVNITWRTKAEATKALREYVDPFTRTVRNVKKEGMSLVYTIKMQPRTKKYALRDAKATLIGVFDTHAEAEQYAEDYAPFKQYATNRQWLRGEISTREHDARASHATINPAHLLAPREYGGATDIVIKHYGLDRVPTLQEVNAEIANVKRKHASGLLDDFSERLWAAFHREGLV